VGQQTNSRREQIASLMTMIGILLAAFQMLVNAFDLASKSFAPFLNALPALIVIILVMGALAAVNVLRLSSSAQRRRRAGVLLAIMSLAALGWSGWQVYERVREPSAPILLVADFKRCDTCKERIIGAQIYECLKLELSRLKLTNIELHRTFDAYSSSDIARARGKRGHDRRAPSVHAKEANSKIAVPRVVVGHGEVTAGQGRRLRKTRSGNTGAWRRPHRAQVDGEHALFHPLRGRNGRPCGDPPPCRRRGRRE